MRTTLLPIVALAAALALIPAVALADDPPPMTPAQRMASRFPQPVRVGDLLGRPVLKPVESQNVLGHVRAVVRRADGGLDLVIASGGVLGLFTRPVAVPIEAVALVGPDVALLDVTPEQLHALPTFDAKRPALGADETIAVALTRPFH